MRTRLVLVATAAAVVALGLAGCSSGGGSTDTAGAPSPAVASSPGASPAPGMPSEESAGAELAAAQSSLGEIVVDGAGMTAYYFDKDTKDAGSSACTGDCAALWPAITSATAAPVVSGVTGEVGTIPTAEGGFQITVDGRPVYTYAKDAAPGDVTGQGVGGVWWVIAPAGDEIDG